jgi:hypothetical protein
MEIKENNYAIVMSDDVEALSQSVTFLQKRGYVCIGGLAQEGIKLKQALVLPAPQVPIQDYVLVRGSDPEELEVNVRVMLAQGWRLHDGPTSYATTQVYDRDWTVTTHGIVQAMVK